MLRRPTARALAVRSLPLRALLPSAFLSASALVACGGGGSSSTGTTSTSTTTTTATTTTTTTTTSGTGGSGGGTTSGTGGMGGGTTSGTGGMGGGTPTGTGGAGGAGTGGTGGAGGSLFCQPGTKTPCYDGPANTEGKGICLGGESTCKPDGSAYGPCEGQVLPQPETCLTPDDDDCNGVANDQGVGCACQPGTSAPCYDGPAGTEGKGICKGGTHMCNAQGTGYGACMSQVTPQAEDCTTAEDENCDGMTPACPGTTVWARVQGDTLDDESNSVTVDAAGNVVVGAYGTLNPDFGCGQLAIGQNYTGVLIKYANDGTCLWNKAFVDPGVDHKSEVKVVTTDAAGNIYVAGIFFGGINLGGAALVSATPLESDIFVGKFSPAGQHMWSKGFGAAGSQVVKAIRVDSQGNVIIAGMFSNQLNFGGVAGTNMVSNGNLDAFIAKFTTNGTHVCSKRFGDASPQAAYGLAVDGSDNFAITGPLYGTANFGGANLTSAGFADVYVAEFNPNCGHLWSKKFGDAADQTAIGFASDSAGNLAVTGTYSGTLDFGGGISITTVQPSDAFIAKLDTNGTPLWTSTGTGPDNQEFDQVGFDMAGNAIAAGFVAGSVDFGFGTLASAGVQDMLIVKFNPMGMAQWSRRFGSPGTELARSIAVDPGGASYATGVCAPTDFGNGVQSGLGGEELFVVKLAP